MSRVVYSNTPDTPEQQGLRSAHQVRLVSVPEEGSGIKQLPGGVYGFTYSPGLDSAPLFATRSFRSYETHKLASGEVTLIGFTSADVARQLTTAPQDITIQVQPHPETEQSTLVEIPYSRIRTHRQYAAPNQHGFTVTVAPLMQHADV
jgi:hypothetical protein